MRISDWSSDVCSSDLRCLPGQSARGKRRMTSIVLDASALLAMLRDEPGGDKVADVLNGSHMCVVNLAEVTSNFVHNDMPPHEVDAMLHPLPVTLVEADAELARENGRAHVCTPVTNE